MSRDCLLPVAGNADPVTGRVNRVTQLLFYEGIAHLKEHECDFAVFLMHLYVARGRQIAIAHMRFYTTYAHITVSLTLVAVQDA